MTEALAALAALTLMKIVLGRKDPSPSAESFLGRAPLPSVTAQCAR